eukprot:TRINITY_DN11401_c0_g1_i1.p1 TRINITY_DN11401_c0_g1~~TRINITY_DN11401_c0_g1_i1.p1  ORF type:complete len:104 (-),score=2.71 TRINITY_DN11401_c0_g1_i1:23-334(-)
MGAVPLPLSRPGPNMILGATVPIPSYALLRFVVAIGGGRFSLYFKWCDISSLFCVRFKSRSTAFSSLSYGSLFTASLFWSPVLFSCDPFRSIGESFFDVQHPI